ncbi:MAG: SCO family protein [Alphaproteobacteria bacterium]|jgi:protein SCO1/2|nr:SCO family protein [Alphaproteobacteria bacterium]
MQRPLIYLGLAVAVIVAGVWGWRYLAPAGGPGRAGDAAWLAGEGDFGGPFDMVDHRGRAVSDADFHGKFMLVYFGYTFCPDTCPVGLMNMTLALDLLPGNGAQVTPVFITIDPARDTPAVLADYVPAFHPNLVGLTGTAAQVAAVAKAFRVYYTKLKVAEGEDPDDYFMGHTNTTYLLGPDGKALTTFSGASEPETIAAGIRKFLAAS